MNAPEIHNKTQDQGLSPANTDPVASTDLKVIPVQDNVQVNLLPAINSLPPESPSLVDRDDPLDEKNKKPSCPPGGCKTDTKLNKDTYEDDMQQIAKKSNLDLSDPRQRRIAHMEILPLFRKRVRQNKKYEKQDKEGPSYAQGPEFILKDGHIYYQDSEESLMEMYEKQKRVRPDQYDKKEHDTMKLIEENLRNGALKAGHVGHNKDADGNEAIRDGIVLTWDAETQTGKMDIYNITQNGKYLSIEEASEVMKNKFSDLTEIHPQNGVVIFTDRPLSEEQVDKVFAQPDLESPPVAHLIEMKISDRYLSPDEYYEVQTTSDRTHVDGIVEKTVKDTTDMVTAGAANMHREVVETIRAINKKENIRIIPDFLRRLFEVNMVRQREGVAFARIVDVPLQTDRVHDLSDNSEIYGDDNQILWKEILMDALGYSTEEAEIFATEMDSTWRDITRENADISLIVNTKTKEVSTILDLLDIVIISNKVEAQMTPKEQEIISAYLTSSGETVFQKQEKNENSERPMQIDVTVLSWVRDFIHELNDLPTADMKKVIMKEEIKTMINIRSLWEIIISFGLSDSFFSKSEAAGDQAYVEQASIAITFWMILKFSAYLESIVAVKKIVSGFTLKKEKNSQHTKDIGFLQEVKTHMSEELIPLASAPWLLLAIIWHLAMIREQGMSANQGSQKVKKHTKKSSSKSTHVSRKAAPFDRVIFAYAS